jgi:hypothetical protein
MRRKNKNFAKLGLLFTIILFLLAGISASYSAWTNTITIQGTINTMENFNYLCMEGWWKFDEGSGSTAEDSSWNSNDGDVYGASWTTDTPSGSGYALYFNGINDYVEVPGDTDDSITTDLTLTAWIKYDNDHRGGIISNDVTYLSNKGFDFFVWDGKLYIDVGNGIQHGRISYTVPTSGWYSSWHHVAATWDGSNLVLYVDGSYVGSVSLGGTYSDPDQDIWIGRINTMSYPAYNWPFNGIIDEVKIYSCALDANEIWDEYQAGLQI